MCAYVCVFVSEKLHSQIACCFLIRKTTPQNHRHLNAILTLVTADGPTTTQRDNHIGSYQLSPAFTWEEEGGKE